MAKERLEIRRWLPRKGHQHGRGWVIRADGRDMIWCSTLGEARELTQAAKLAVLERRGYADEGGGVRCEACAGEDGAAAWRPWEVILAAGSDACSVCGQEV